VTGPTKAELAAQVGALRDVLTAIRDTVEVPYPQLDLSDEGFDAAACDKAREDFHDAQRDRAIHVFAAAAYALEAPFGTDSIRTTAKVLRDQAARPLPYTPKPPEREPEPEAEAGQ
jgi:hypothetical protein